MSNITFRRIWLRFTEDDEKEDMSRLSFSWCWCFLFVLFTQSIARRCSTQCHPLSPCPFVSDLPSAPHMISLSPNCVANVLVAWPWQPRPSRHTDTEVLLSPTTSQTLRATTLYQPSCCFSHLLFASVSFNPSFVSVLLCSVWNTDGPPPQFPIPSFSFGPQTTVM